MSKFKFKITKKWMQKLSKFTCEKCQNVDANMSKSKCKKLSKFKCKKM